MISTSLAWEDGHPNGNGKGNGYGHESHGNGHGYGHDKDEDTPPDDDPDHSPGLPLDDYAPLLLLGGAVIGLIKLKK